MNCDICGEAKEWGVSHGCPPFCGDCLVPIKDCNHGEEYNK